MWLLFWDVFVSEHCLWSVEGQWKKLAKGTPVRSRLSEGQHMPGSTVSASVLLDKHLMIPKDVNLLIIHYWEGISRLLLLI